MLLSELVNQETEAVRSQPIQVTPMLLQRIISMIDLTSLQLNDTEESIALFCQKAQTPLGSVAAVCVYPDFVDLVAQSFADTHIKAATVVNFPKGNSSLEAVLIEINQGLEAGAQEIDLVLPYERYMQQDRAYVRDFVEAAKAACGPQVLLKVILETGALQDVDLIADASKDVFEAGADFVKTSTGKIAQGATLEAAAAMLFTIKSLSQQLKRPLGLKVSGGIREIEEAARYLELAERFMGPGWATPSVFRIGASQLVDQIIRTTLS